MGDSIKLILNPSTCRSKHLPKGHKGDDDEHGEQLILNEHIHVLLSSFLFSASKNIFKVHQYNIELAHDRFFLWTVCSATHPTVLISSLWEC